MKKDDLMMTSGLNELLKHEKSHQACKKAIGMVQSLARRISKERPSPVQFYRSLDQSVEEAKREFGGEIQCKSGCSSCCYQVVDVTPKEAQLLASAIRTKDIDIDGDEWDLQSKMTASQLRDANRPCVFLKDKKCGAYDIRPGNCRKYFVVGSPEQCRLEPNKGPRAVDMLLMIESEILMSSLLESEREMGPLPHMISKEMVKLSNGHKYKPREGMYESTVSNGGLERSRKNPEVIKRSRVPSGRVNGHM